MISHLFKSLICPLQVLYSFSHVYLKYFLLGLCWRMLFHSTISVQLPRVHRGQDGPPSGIWPHSLLSCNIFATSFCEDDCEHFYLYLFCLYSLLYEEIGRNSKTLLTLWSCLDQNIGFYWNIWHIVFVKFEIYMLVWYIYILQYVCHCNVS